VQPTYAQSTVQPTPRVRKPTLDEMTVGRTEVPLGEKPRPTAKPDLRVTRTVDVPDDTVTKGPRRGRPRKTGRPGA
jgi:excinuclease ABC subunit B